MLLNGVTFETVLFLKKMHICLITWIEQFYKILRSFYMTKYVY